MIFNNRRYEVIVDDKPFIIGGDGIQFRITFNVLIDFGGRVSYMDLSIYNLSKDTSSKILKKGSKLSFRCGYDGSEDLIFVGSVRNILKMRNGPDVITQVIATGGSQPKTKIITKGFGVNSKVVDVIKSCVAAMGYPVVIDAESFSDIHPYARGYSMSGDPRVYLDELAKSNDFSWVIDNDRVVINRNSSYRNGVISVISEGTGMEGVPEITENGVDVSTRINPKIRIGGRVRIESEFRSFNFSNAYFQDIPEGSGTGVYRVFKVEHSGDSHGDEWTTKVTGYR